jgi:hypothetical protein
MTALFALGACGKEADEATVPGSARPVPVEPTLPASEPTADPAAQPQPADPAAPAQGAQPATPTEGAQPADPADPTGGAQPAAPAGDVPVEPAPR